MRRTFTAAVLLTFLAIVCATVLAPIGDVTGWEPDPILAFGPGASPAPAVEWSRPSFARPRFGLIWRYWSVQPGAGQCWGQGVTWSGLQVARHTLALELGTILALGGLLALIVWTRHAHTAA